MIARKLEYLVALAREKHFARAAMACHVSQAALSAGIQPLEINLGAQIMKRGRYGSSKRCASLRAVTRTDYLRT
jgi:DNA-binding transcriptional LysR family regulator